MTSGTRCKVLVVDADEAARSRTASWLSDEGHSVVTYDRGLGAVQVVRKEAPDVVLLDLQLPALSGESVAQVLVHQSTIRQPLLILQAATDEATLQAAVKRTGVDGAIAKTENREAFLAAFTGFLRTRAALAARGGAARVEQPPKRRRQPKVLLVVEAAELRARVAPKLEAAGLRVVLHDQALGTTRRILQERPDVVLVSAGLTDLSGDALAQLIASQSGLSEVAVVLLVAAGVVTPSNAGQVDGVVTADDPQLAERLARILERRRQG